MAMGAVVIMVVVAGVNVRVGIRPTGAIAGFAGFAHGERHKVTLRPQHP